MKLFRHSHKYLIPIIVLLMIAAFSYTACISSVPSDDDDASDKDKKNDDMDVDKKPKKAPSAAPPKTTEIRVEDTIDEQGGIVEGNYQYNPINKVDPFVPFAGGGFDQPNVAGSETTGVLTQYEVRYFKLVGIVGNEEQPRAIFEDPRGHAYVVGIGTKIGRNNGVIEQINDNSVLIIEKRIKFTVEGGEPVPVPLTINLHPQREE